MAPEEPPTGSGQVSRSGWQWSVVPSRIDDSVHLICVDVINKAYVALELFPTNLRLAERPPEMFWGYIKLIIEGMTMDLVARIEQP